MIRRSGTNVVEFQIDNPTTRNALALGDLELLASRLEAVSDDPDVRVILLSATGSVFSSGADMAELDGEESVRRFEELLERIAVAMSTVPQPIVCRVQGPVFGAGLVLVAMSDIAILSESASFGLPEPRFGLVATAAAATCIPRLAPATALDAFLTGRRVSAHDAQRAGLAARVALPEHLDAVVQEVVQGVLEGAPGAIALTKRMVRALQADRPTDSLESARAASSGLPRDEAAEATNARREGRKPRWAVAWGSPA